MIILAEKKRPDLIFKNRKGGRTLDFPDLFKNMQQNYNKKKSKFIEYNVEFIESRSRFIPIPIPDILFEVSTSKL